MTLVTLSPEERAFLEQLIPSTPHANTLRRAQVVLGLADGESPPAVARRLRVTRQTVYNWVSRFEHHRTSDLLQGVTTGVRSGRPRTVHGVIDPLIAQVIDGDPRALGYRSTVWTAALLAQYLWEDHDITVSRQSVSAAIDRLGLRWKRPRHRLARRSPTWRQAKGGSSAGYGHARALSSSCSTKR
jgi:transposase